MNTGKLTNEQLKSLVLDKLPILSPSTLVGAGIGADCAWLNLGDKLLVTSSDPITAGGMQSGTLAIHVSCNDIAACGIKPSGILFVIIAPTFATEEDISEIVSQASAEAKKLGADIVGGHTEVSDSVNNFVVITTAFGIADKDHPVPAGKGKIGDSLILTKSCGIEGSYIAVKEHRDKLTGIVSENLLLEAERYNELISVVKEGTICGLIESSTHEINENGFKVGGVSLMHDVTEGGVLGAAHEMASFSKTGVNIRVDDVPVTEATREICKALGLDPLRLISSGSLLIATSEPDKIGDALKKAGIEATVIGELTEEGFTIENSDGSRDILTPPQADEIYKI